MALRMRRRRKMELAQGVADQLQDAARAGLERVADVAAAAPTVIAAAGTGVTRGKSRRLRRASVGIAGLLLAAAVAAALYRWWSRRRQDEEFARLHEMPNEPDSHPSAPSIPPAPVAAVEPETTPAPARAFATEQRPDNGAATEAPASPPPWVAPTPVAPAPPAAPAAALETQGERAQRAAWNSNQREVPLFVLPLRPSVPFRGTATPVAGRARLPGSDSSFLR